MRFVDIERYGGGLETRSGLRLKRTEIGATELEYNVRLSQMANFRAGADSGGLPQVRVGDGALRLA